MSGSRRRQLLIGGVTLAIMVVLIGRLWSLQLGPGAPGDRDGNETRIRLLVTDAPRGRILDVSGRELAISEPILSLTLDWQALVDLEPEERDAVWATAATELRHAGYAISADDLATHYEHSAGRELVPRVVVEDLDPGAWLALAERRLPGLAVERTSRRAYPNGALAAHVIGHVGVVVDAAEADRLNSLPASAVSPYRAGDAIGRAGIESRYESVLRGRPQLTEVEIDDRNRIVRTMGVIQRARPGHDVQLTIAIDLQRAAEQAIADQLAAARSRPPTCGGCPPSAAPAGSVVALRPGDGAVVAMASHPSFDPSVFVAADGAEVGALLDDESQPLLNRAIAGQYAPGSTFKPVTAHVAVADGVRGPAEVWVDTGTHRIGSCRPSTGKCEYRNAGGVALGPVDLPAALSRSSDTYFYSIGEKLWNDRAAHGREPIQDTARRWGFGALTGVDIDGEASGRVPAAADGRWFTGDNVNLAIGQGQLLVTPVQLATAYAGLANDGTRYEPRVVARVLDPESGRVVADNPPGAATDIGLHLGAAAALHTGLEEAPIAGTAAAAFQGFPFELAPVAGKTGTAQVDGKADTALFVGYGRAPLIDLVVAVVLEEAGWGGTAAAPVARSVFEAAIAERAPVVSSW